MLLVKRQVPRQRCFAPIMYRAMQENVLYGLYTVWLFACWAYAILPVMTRLVPKSAVVLS